MSLQHGARTEHRVIAEVVLPADMIEAIAERAAAIVLARQLLQEPPAKSHPPHAEKVVPDNTVASPAGGVEDERDLAVAIAAYLANHDCASQTEIGRAVRARDEDVRAQLQGDLRFELLGRCRSRPRHHPNSNCWTIADRLVPTTRTRQGGDGGGTRDPEPNRGLPAPQTTPSAPA
jgi:hypothetical protein